MLGLFPKLLSLFRVCLWHIQIKYLIGLNYFILFEKNSPSLRLLEH